MKIACIIPTRGDRPMFLNHCIEQVAAQTVKPDAMLIYGATPIDNKCDLVYRVRSAYEKYKNDYDLFFIIEDDDYYPDDYIESVLNLFSKNTPDLIGIQKSIYYHVKAKKYKILNHTGRSSLFCTVIKGGLEIDWPKDDTPFLDISLWKNSKLSRGFHEPKNMPIGIKHGIGKTGGNGHIDKHYNIKDHGMNWLQERVRKESFEFYKTI